MIDRLEGNKIVGIKQTTKAVKNESVKKIYLAKDVNAKILETLIKIAQEKSITIKYIDTARELGKMCGIDVGASAAGVLK